MYGPMIVVWFLVVGSMWFQGVSSYVIVNKDRDLYANSLPSSRPSESVQSYAEPYPIPPQDSLAHERPHVKNLLELYYLVQVVRSYRRPSYLEMMAVAGGLFEQLTGQAVRSELASLLTGVDGFEEITNVGEYPEPDRLKEQLANDFRLLFPLVGRSLGELRASAEHGIGALQEKLHRTAQDLRSLLASVSRLESEVLDAIDQPGASHDVANEKREVEIDEGASNAGKLQETIYETEIPVASSKDVVNDYDLEEKPLPEKTDTSSVTEASSESDEVDKLRFLPKGSEVVYELSPPLSQELDDDSEDDPAGVILLTEDAQLNEFSDISAMAAESHVPKAVSLKDPEMIALVPVIVEQLREGNVTEDEQQTLAEIFGQLWPLMVAEAARLRTE